MSVKKTRFLCGENKVQGGMVSIW